MSARRLIPAPARRIASAVACITILAIAAVHAGDTPFPSEVPGCGIRATGDCWEPNASSGCTWTPCCELICTTYDPFCCQGIWSADCVQFAELYCPPLPVCESATGTCTEPGTGRGCGEKSCCYLVCALDPFCCDTIWDSVCAGIASGLCDAPFCPLPGKASHFEDEACDERSNDGCNDPETLFTPVVCGQRWYGELHAAIRRDTDWYRMDFPSAGTVVVELHAEFSAEVIIASGACSDGYQVEAIGVAGPCEPVTIRAAVPPGIVWIIIAPATGEGPHFSGIPCASEPPPWSPVLPRGYEFSIGCR